MIACLHRDANSNFDFLAQGQKITRRKFGSQLEPYREEARMQTPVPLRAVNQGEQ